MKWQQRVSLLYEWFFSIYPMPYKRIKNVLSVSLNKAFPSVLPSNKSSGGSMFPHYTNGSLPYVQRHITIL